jgi:endonuclease YncB( thermonuclease family)
MNRIIIVAALYWLSSGAVFAEELSGTAVEIQDGSTLTLSSGERVRLFGIQTPARSQMCESGGVCTPCGETSREALRTLAVGSLTCEKWGKSLGLVIARCFAGGEELSLKMLTSGQAMVFRRYLHRGQSLPPEFVIAETRAKDNRRGIWASEFIRPWNWRHGGYRLACEPESGLDESRRGVNSSPHLPN